MDFQDQNVIQKLSDQIKLHILTNGLSERDIIDFETLIAKEFIRHTPKIDRTAHHDLYLDLDSSHEGFSALNTSFKDCFFILNYLSKENSGREITICDIGAGHAKLAIVASLFFKNVKVISIEPVKERTWFLQALCGDENIYHEYFKKHHCDIHFDYAFFYFPVCHALDDILKSLESKSHLLGLCSIESHGDFFARLSLETHWLEIEDIGVTVFPRHNRNIRLYKRISTKSISPLRDLFDAIKKESYYYLIGTDSIGKWIEKVNECDINFFNENEFVIQSKTSFRNYRVDINTIHHLNFINEIPQVIEELIEKRSQSHKMRGHQIRKVYMDQRVELSNGLLVTLES